MKGLLYMLPVVVIIAIFASRDITASIPPEVSASIHLDCARYIGLSDRERIEQWNNTFRGGLRANPELGQDVRMCVMESKKIVSTDQFIYNICKADVRSPFKILVMAALEMHLEKCSVGIQE